MGNQGHTFDNPYDNALSASTRFAVEVIAWVAGPWAAAGISLWLVIPAVAVLVGLPAIFSTVGDKRKIVVATPGPIRIAIEYCSTWWPSPRRGPFGHCGWPF